MRKRTKNLKRLKIIFWIASITATLIPFVFYLIKAFIEGDPGQKFTLGSTILVATVLLLINVIFKLRSALWVLVLGIYICLKDIAPMLLTVAICTIADELILSPLARHFSRLHQINVEIDKGGSKP